MVWRAKDVHGVDTGRIAFHVDSQSNGAHVADVSAKASDPLANARLIAAAPTMRDALKAVLAHAGCDCTIDPLNPCDAGGQIAGKHRGVGAACGLCQARAALAAAEGREP